MKSYLCKLCKKSGPKKEMRLHVYKIHGIKHASHGATDPKPRDGSSSITQALEAVEV